MYVHMKLLYPLQKRIARLFNEWFIPESMVHRHHLMEHSIKLKPILEASILAPQVLQVLCMHVVYGIK